MTCAVAAAVLAVLVPALIRSLPEPRSDETGADEQVPTYAEVARTRGVRTVAVVVSAVAGAAVGWRLGATWLLLGLVPMIPILVMLAIVDWRTRRLPRLVVLPATGGLLALLGIEWLLTHDSGVLVRAILGMLLARSLAWLAWWMRPSAVGFGDVRLAALVGLVLGRMGWSAWGIGLYAGLVLFAAYGIAYAVRAKSRSALRHELPYGPFMAAGLFVGVMLVG